MTCRGRQCGTCNGKGLVSFLVQVSGRSIGLQWVPANRTEPRGDERTPRLDGPSIIQACDAELRRLGTDYIDLWQLHWPDRYTPSFGRAPACFALQSRPLQPC